MPDAKKKMSPATLAAFLAGAGFGVGTEIIIKEPSDAPEPAGWACTVMANEQILCREVGSIEIPSDDLVVKDLPDAGARIDPFDGGRDE